MNITHVLIRQPVDIVCCDVDVVTKVLNIETLRWYLGILWIREIYFIQWRQRV